MSKFQTILLGILAALVAAAVFVVSRYVPTASTALATVGTGLASLATWLIGLAMTHPVDKAALAVVAPAPDTVTKPEKPSNIVPGPGALALLVLGIAMLLGGTARAQQFGGCVDGGLVCFGPSATVTVGQFNLATQKFSGGVVPGIGYGATYAQTQWYATGLAAYLSFSVGQGQPNQAIPSLMLSFANYVRVGAGVSITETDGPVQTQWRLLFGLGTDIGGSPNYVRSEIDGARIKGIMDGSVMK
jgi:hypothetical protein